MTQEDLQEILERYRAGKATPEDEAFLESWYLNYNGADWHEMLDDDRTKDLDLAWSAIQRDIQQPKRAMLWRRIMTAASVVIAISFASYFYINSSNKKEVPKEPLSFQKNDIAPGGNKARLTLADGRQIILTDAENGQLAEQSGITIRKTADGQLVYNISNSESSSPSLSYNTIETPPGGQYQVILPDGTKVWLNSASSLRYPIRFTGNERKVEISGEAYFEVSHNREMPFRVINRNQTVEVLGTHFNVMAYPDEISTNTTLLEGSVKVVRGNKNKIIMPGQQTRVTDENMEVANVDVSQVTAWKDGYFVFKNEDIRSIMRQISRWYNLEVTYQGEIPEKVFGGKISRARNVSEVLKFLESTGSIQFKIISGDSGGRERGIIVMP